MGKIKRFIQESWPYFLMALLIFLLILFTYPPFWEWVNQI
jgi:hypothetical protein